MNIGTAFKNLKNPCIELPKKGQRVRVICIKEMIFMGNEDPNGSEWVDDGHGNRGIVFWEEIIGEKDESI